MRLYLARHGESEANAKATYMAHSTKLSALGIRQAKQLAKRFLKLPVDIIFSSDYPRALETANYIQKVTKKKLLVSKLVREEKHPSKFNGKSIYDPEVVRVKALLRNNYHKLWWHYDDEENFIDVKTRVQKFIRLVQKRKEKNIVVVNHGVTMRMIIAIMMLGDALTPKIFQGFRESLLTRNTGITVCEFNGKRWQVLTWNDHAHLG